MKKTSNSSTLQFIEPTQGFGFTQQTSDWSLPEEGELAVDVLETAHEIIVRSAIAGVPAENLELHVSHDSLTIRGTREECQSFPHATAHVEECHWGAFSRTILLPANVLVEGATATMQHGVLTITLPKTTGSGTLNVQTLL